MQTLLGRVSSESLLVAEYNMQDSEKLQRHTDENQLSELCKFPVQSLMRQPVEYLLQLAKDATGSRVVETFFESKGVSDL